MKNPVKGQRVRIIGNTVGHPYPVDGGAVYTVTAIDNSDDTVKLVAVNGSESSGWIPFSDISPTIHVGWDYLRTQLPAEALELLSSFDGLEELSLKPEIAARVVLRTPNLKESLIEIAVEMAEEKANAPQIQPNQKRRRFLP